MAQDLAQRLREVIEGKLERLLAIPDEDAGAPGPSGGWSRKQELGHLLDSAANNHQRFVRAALEGEYNGPGYQQRPWVDLHGYAEWHWTDLVTFWQQYNAMLARLIERIPAERLGARCVIAAGEPVTLKFVIEDYLAHLLHHLDHIVSQANVSANP